MDGPEPEGGIPALLCCPIAAQSETGPNNKRLDRTIETPVAAPPSARMYLGTMKYRRDVGAERTNSAFAFGNRGMVKAPIPRGATSRLLSQFFFRCFHLLFFSHRVRGLVFRLFQARRGAHVAAGHVVDVVGLVDENELSLRRRQSGDHARRKK